MRMSSVGYVDSDFSHAFVSLRDSSTSEGRGMNMIVLITRELTPPPLHRPMLPQVREAFEILRSEESRSRYDVRHRAWEEAQQRAARERAEQEQQERQAAEEERERRLAREKAAADAEELRKKKQQEAEQAAKREEEERRRLLEREERRRKAEERSREAARKYSELQAELARERIRKEREEEVKRREEEVARKFRAEQERLAAERLRVLRIEERQAALRRAWGSMREAAEEKSRSGRGSVPKKKVASSSCRHPAFGWPKKNGSVECGFCGEHRRKWYFCCPACYLAACPACKQKVEVVGTGGC